MWRAIIAEIFLLEFLLIVFFPCLNVFFFKKYFNLFTSIVKLSLLISTNIIEAPIYFTTFAAAT